VSFSFSFSFSLSLSFTDSDNEAAEVAETAPDVVEGAKLEEEVVVIGAVMGTVALSVLTSASDCDSNSASVSGVRAVSVPDIGNAASNSLVALFSLLSGLMLASTVEATGKVVTDVIASSDLEALVTAVVSLTSTAVAVAALELEVEEEEEVEVEVEVEVEGKVELEVEVEVEVEVDVEVEGKVEVEVGTESETDQYDSLHGDLSAIFTSTTVVAASVPTDVVSSVVFVFVEGEVTVLSTVLIASSTVGFSLAEESRAVEDCLEVQVEVDAEVDVEFGALFVAFTTACTDDQ
jgi:hypothetical protein